MLHNTYQSCGPCVWIQLHYIVPVHRSTGKFEVLLNEWRKGGDIVPSAVTEISKHVVTRCVSALDLYQNNYDR